MSYLQLQMFYYVAPLRALMMSHLCEREFCLVCELGFLFHMLDVSMGQGIPCHASNFLRAFRTIPEASAMSLTLSDQDNRAKINFALKIQVSFMCYCCSFELHLWLLCREQFQGYDVRFMSWLTWSLFQEMYYSHHGRHEKLWAAGHSCNVMMMLAFHFVLLCLRALPEGEKDV